MVDLVVDREKVGKLPDWIRREEDDLMHQLGEPTLSRHQTYDSRRHIKRLMS